MTNFEKWRKNLTPEDLVRTGYHAGTPYKALDFSCRGKCPVENCPRKEPGNTIRDDICFGYFMEWAHRSADVV